MKNAFTYIHTVEPSHCDNNNILTPISLISIFPDLAAAHSTYVGLNENWYSKENTAWVLIHYNIEFYRFPTLGENLSCFTWAQKYKRIQSLRSFSIFDESNNPIAKAGSSWVLIDTKKRRPVKPSDDMFEKYVASEPYVFENINFEQPDLSSSIPQKESIITVTSKDIDINNHVNNLVYIDWHLSNINSSKLAALSNYSKLKSINVHYQKESVLGDKINHKFYSSSTYNTETIHNSQFYTTENNICKISSYWDS